MKVKVTILGSGTSTGVPVIGCDCDVCLSDVPENKRLRTSIMLTRLDTNEHLVIDTTPDFRAQMLRENVKRLKKVLYTHTHADHLHGFDDLRAFYFHSREKLECYLKKSDLEDVKRRFSYAFEATGYQGVAPQVELVEIGTEPFKVWDDFTVEPIELVHGNVKSTAFRFGRFAYATDFKTFTQADIEKWRGKITTMVCSGLHFRTHYTHSIIPETLELLDQLEVENGIITHTSHEVDYHKVNDALPNGRKIAYDGMSFVVEI